MTRIEILQQLKGNGELNKIRDAWKANGEATITPFTKSVTKDTLYHVRLNPNFIINPALPIESQYTKTPGQELDGSIIFCENELVADSEFNWATSQIYDIEEGYIVDSFQIISPNFRILLTNEELLSITEPFNPEYIPFVQTSDTEIIISDEELNIILKDVGVPFVRMEELEFPRNVICESMIKPALQEYYKFFPIIKTETNFYGAVTSGQRLRLEMPENAFGVTRAIIASGPTVGSGPSGNPLYFFVNEVATQTGTMTGSGIMKRYSSGMSVNNFSTYGLLAASKQAVVNYNTRMEFRVERWGKKRYFTGYSNRTGMLEVTWAYYSYNWDHVDWNRLREVRQLAEAYVMRALGMLRSQSASDTAKLDFSGFISRADALEKDTLDFWKSFPRTVVIRGAL